MRITRDEMFRVVCMIFTPSTHKVGTGCFIEKEGTPYLVTAEHVKNDVLPDSLIVFGDYNSNCYSVLLSCIISGQWLIHPIADLSAIKLDIAKLDEKFSNRFFPITQVDNSQKPISRDLTLTVAGFPSGLGTAYTGSSKFSPLTFRSFASSSYMTLQRADKSINSDFFCLENPAMGGYSGGPVLDLGYEKTPLMLQEYGDTILLGFIHGTQSDNTGGKIAYVTPSYYLHSLLP